MNFAKVGSSDGPMKKAYDISYNMESGSYVRDWIMETHTCYRKEEMIFYNSKGEITKNKLAISFDILSYVKNLVGTLQRVYSFLYQPSYYPEQLHYRNLHMIVQRKRLHMIQNTIGAYPVM